MALMSRLFSGSPGARSGPGFDEQALLRITRCKKRAAVTPSAQRFRGVQPQASHGIFQLRAVTGVALFHKDGPDFLFEEVLLLFAGRRRVPDRGEWKQKGDDDSRNEPSRVRTMYAHLEYPDECRAAPEPLSTNPIGTLFTTGTRSTQSSGAATKSMNETTDEHR